MADILHIALTRWCTNGSWTYPVLIQNYAKKEVIDHVVKKLLDGPGPPWIHLE